MKIISDENREALNV